MKDLGTTIIIGIGSPHGDDQFGWTVVDHLASLNDADVKLHKISNPVDLIPELEAYERVILIDASVGLPQLTPFMRLDYADLVDRKLVQEMPSQSTHDVGLYLALRMAESLCKKTSHVSLWIGRGKSFAPMSKMNSTTAMAATDCAAAIAKELCDARNVAC